MCAPGRLTKLGTKPCPYGIVYRNTTFNGTPPQTLMGPSVTDSGPSPLPNRLTSS